MKSNHLLRVIVLLALFFSLAPTGGVAAFTSATLPTPPTDIVFQLPWDQGVAWMAVDGFDYGLRRPRNSPHNYVYGGAVDFAPRRNMVVGEDTSNFWVTAAAAGTVVEKTSCSLKIAHGNGWITEYQFLGNFQVKLGDAVYRNQRLAVIADGKRQKFCAPLQKFDMPHLHFTLRPNMRGATFAGWTINYNSLWNQTTFTKSETVGLYKPLMNLLEAQIVLRDPITWDVIYIGTVDAYRYERWPFTLTEATNFTLTATPTTSGLVPLMLLLDANGNEITRSDNGSLTSSQPAGNYFVQIQPQSGSGFYNLLLHNNGQTLPTGPYILVDAPASVEAGKSVPVNVNLMNVPVDGYTSAEMTCTYNASLINVDSISAAGLFGTDPAVAVSGPSNGSFIVAIAGSNHQKATTSGTAFTFNAIGLQAGQTELTCTARISKGDNLLTAIEYVGDSLTVFGIAPTATPPPLPTSTPPAPTSPVLTGQVIAAKPVTVHLYGLDQTLAASVDANPDGTFRFDVSAGAYTIVATANGFLRAEGAITLADGDVRALPAISLLAGDIDGNNVVDQFDAMTIGMSYNTAQPPAADLNNDGLINVLDLELLARNYRVAGPLVWQ